MKHLNYFIAIDADAELALNLILEKIPCFITWHADEDGENWEVDIRCREKDAAYIESMLAAFV